MIYQINVHLKPGQRTYEGHPFVGWSKPYHPEFFDDHRTMMARCEHWRNAGVKVELGKMTKRSK